MLDREVVTREILAMTSPQARRLCSRPSVAGPDRGGDADGAAGPVHAVIAQERIEDAGEATGEGDDGDVLATTGRDAQGPGAERLGLGRLATKNGDGGLDEEPARAAGAGFGDGAGTLGVPGAALAGAEAEVAST